MKRARTAYFRKAPAALLLLSSLAAGGCVSGFFSVYPPLPRNAIPPVAAVSSFENRSGYNGQWELGSGMADLLLSELIKSRHFTLVERGRLDQIVDEIQRQKNHMFRAEGRVEDGRLKNARYMIRGTVTDFSQSGGGRISVAYRNLLSLGRGGYRARVALALTLVDVESGQIIDSVQSAADVAAHDTFASGTYKNVTFGGDTFFRTPLGVATGRAIEDGVHEILKRIPHVFWVPMIASVQGRSLVLNGGRQRGFREGQVYQVRGEGRAVTDPATGDLLSVIPGPLVGTIRLTQVEKDVAWAEPVQGGSFERGQRLVAADESKKK